MFAIFFLFLIIKELSINVFAFIISILFCFYCVHRLSSVEAQSIEFKKGGKCANKSDSNKFII